MHIDIAEGLTTTRSHWYWRPGWVHGRRMYTFHLTMGQAPALLALAERMRPVLAATPELDPVPLNGLHLTMNGVGFTDEVTPLQLKEISNRVFRAWATCNREDLRFDRALLAAECLMLPTAARPWLEVMNTAQRQAIDAVIAPRQWGRFQPHVTLAYCNAAGEPKQITQALSRGLEDETDPLWAHPTLTLMRLGRDREVYEWEVLRQA